MCVCVCVCVVCVWFIANTTLSPCAADPCDPLDAGDDRKPFGQRNPDPDEADAEGNVYPLAL